MGGRYYITDVQIGIVKALALAASEEIDDPNIKECLGKIDEQMEVILAKQFIGHKYGQKEVENAENRV